VEITRVTVREIDMNMVKGIASIILDDCFVVHDLRVVDGDRGYFVAMPSRKLPNGDFKDIAHPLNSETREMIQEAVLRAFFKMQKEKEGKLEVEEDS
jgi:stage V sporulation protein G